MFSHLYKYNFNIHTQHRWINNMECMKIEIASVEFVDIVFGSIYRILETV